MLSEVQLTEQGRVNLRWMAKCNKLHIGFLGPTVRKHGPVEELSRLIDAGLAVLVEPDGRGDRGGYWITDAGRRALEGE